MFRNQLRQGAGPRFRSVILALSAALLASLLWAAGASAAPPYAYVGGYINNTIGEFSLGSDQTLADNGSVSAGTEPWYVEITPDGKYLYASDWGSDTIDQYSIGSDGKLTALTPAQATTGSGPIGIAISPGGGNLYAANSSGSVTVFDIGSGGQLTPTQTISSGVNAPDSVIVSPDGSSVYVGDGPAGGIFEYDRASDGTLTPKSTGFISVPITSYTSLVITPDQKYVYATGTDNTTIYEFTVGTGGELSQNASTATTGFSDYELTISPNGNNLYAPSSEDHVVYQYSIGTDGALTALTPASATSPSGPEFAWMSDSGASLYSTGYNQTDQFDVSSSGTLSPKSPPSVPVNGDGSLIIPPDQGPVAAFMAATAKAGHPVKFDASSSTADHGTVAQYDWKFGDGTKLSNGGPSPSHTYKRAGKYTVTLTTTDDSGCSTALMFTGTTPYCNADAAAIATHIVKIAALTSRLTVKPRAATAGKRTCFTFRFTSSGHAVRGATVHFADHTRRTGSTGKARICLALHKGMYAARASKSGYRTSRTTVRVRAAKATAPGFTG